MVGLAGLSGAGLLGFLALALILGGVLALRDGLGFFTVLFGVVFIGLSLLLAAFGTRQSVETLDRYFPVPPQRSLKRRRRPVWVWLICLYALLPTYELVSQVISVVRGGESLTAGSMLLLLLLSIKTAAFVGGAGALLGFRASAVLLFTVSLVSTIASMIQRVQFDVVSASVIGLEVAILGYSYAWLLRKQRVST